MIDTVRGEFRILDTIAQFEELLAGPGIRPFVVFKHSATCGISAQAYDDLAEVLDDTDNVPVYLVDVRANREIAQHLARRLGVRHESPQLLLIVDGRVVWHASHFRATAANLRRALRSAGGGEVHRAGPQGPGAVLVRSDRGS